MDKIQYLNYIKDKYKIQPMVRNIFIIGTPSHGNLGDHAIWYATWKLLREMYATANIVDILIEDFFAEIDAIYELTQDQDLIIMQGGGNLGNCYMDDEMIRRYVLLRFQKNQIILFPQTVYFTDDKKGKEELKKSIMIYNSHPNLTLMGRDHVSTCFLKEHFNASIYEAFDVVLTMSAKSEQSRRGALICLRNDSESSLPDPRRKEIISRIERICPELRITDTMDESFAWREEREERVLKKIQEFQMAQIVITDRLHGMIFSAITGTPCIVLNNNNSKVKNCYEKLRNLKYIQFIDDTSSLERDFKSLSKTKENIFDSNSYKEQIKNILKLIEGKKKTEQPMNTFVDIAMETASYDEKYWFEMRHWFKKTQKDFKQLEHWHTQLKNDYENEQTSVDQAHDQLKIAYQKYAELEMWHTRLKQDLQEAQSKQVELYSIIQDYQKKYKELEIWHNQLKLAYEDVKEKLERRR